MVRRNDNAKILRHNELIKITNSYSFAKHIMPELILMRIRIIKSTKGI